MYYLYYVLYKFVLLTPSKNELPEQIANIILSLLVCFNMFIVANVLQYYNVRWVEDFYKRKTLFVIVYFLLLIGYLFFIKDGKYIKIKNKYDKEGNKKRVIKTTLVLFYVGGTIILLFVF